MKLIIFLLSFIALLGDCPISNAEQNAQPSGESLYELTVHLTDQNGKQAGFDVFRGHPVVISMFYASCNYTCPILFDALKKMDAKLDPKIREQVRILLISFDPEHDTPAVLGKLAKDHGLDLARWKLVAPAQAEVQNIAQLLDYTYRAMPSGDFSHASSMTLVDKQGAPVVHASGILDAANTIAERLNKDFALP